MSNSFCGSRPSFSPSTNASQVPIIEIASSMLLQIFAACPAPAPPAWTMRLPIFSRIGFGARERLVAAAAHEGERAGFRAADAAGHRRVEEIEARFLRRRVHGARGIDVDGRAIDQQRVLACAAVSTLARRDRPSAHAGPPAAW